MKHLQTIRRHASRAKYFGFKETNRLSENHSSSKNQTNNDCLNLQNSARRDKLHLRNEEGQIQWQLSSDCCNLWFYRSNKLSNISFTSSSFWLWEVGRLILWNVDGEVAWVCFFFIPEMLVARFVKFWFSSVIKERYSAISVHYI